MKLKPGVNPFGLKPELLLALMVAESVWTQSGVELVVTSLNDGKHSKTSLHYAGCAADIRTNNITEIGKKEWLVEQLRFCLGQNPDYDVILEIDHIHIEYQPKYRGEA